ncbi:hypothetical protein LINPERPRIM_LOCUS28248 [Linum perenne]
MATLPQADQQLPQQQQPGIGYAVPVPSINQLEQPVSHSNNSNGSFGSVFIVLAVIIVVSAVACCLGRFCSKKKHHGGGGKIKKQKKKENKDSKQQKNSKPHQMQSNSKVGQSDDDDIEFGFGKGGGLGRPMREGPNGPHHKMGQPPVGFNGNGYFPHGPPQQKPNQVKKGHNGNSHHSGRFKGDGNGNYPTMEFHDGEPFRH